MPSEGIYAAVSGLRVNTKRVANTAHNVANVSTPGFVPNRLEQANLAQGGVQITGSTPQSPGPLMVTDRSLDLAIEGPGFFALDDGQGGRLYTRAGNFSLNAQGEMVDPLGRTMVPPFQVPEQATHLNITPQGQIQALSADGNVLAQGQIQTAGFGNAAGLNPVGGNAYRATEASGPAVMNTPGAAGHGQIVSGALQASGTDLAREMVDMMVSQRSFEANVRSIQTADDMLGVVLDIKK
jgi:flagellar basal body rod protein FlgG